MREYGGRIPYNFPRRLVSGICTECGLAFTDRPKGSMTHEGACSDKRRLRIQAEYDTRKRRRASK